MTREEAIKELQEDIELYIPLHGTIDDIRDLPDGRLITALEMAIQALSQEPITTTNNDEPMTIIYPTIVCDDSISREYLFKVLDDFCGHDRTATITLDTLADIVYELPSVTQKSGKWIPFSERLPKPFEHCLITTTDGEVIYHYDDGQYSKYKAWMPLPEPYKAKSEDKE